MTVRTPSETSSVDARLRATGRHRIHIAGWRTEPDARLQRHPFDILLICATKSVSDPDRLITNATRLQDNRQQTALLPHGKASRNCGRDALRQIQSHPCRGSRHRSMEFMGARNIARLILSHYRRDRHEHS